MKLLVAGAFLFLLAACGGGGASGRAVGEACSTADDCQGGICLLGQCTEACSQASDCPTSFACGTSAEGQRVCLPACDQFASTGYVCEDGAPVACEQAADAELHCLSCGCADGSYCDIDSDTCKLEQALGEACAEHVECASANCGRTPDTASGVCLVGRDQACTPGAGDCFACDPTIEGDICLQNCRSDADCFSGETCEGYQGDGFYTCRQSCDQTQCKPFQKCRPTGGVPYCEPARRCQDDQDCGLLNECSEEHGLCGILF